MKFERLSHLNRIIFFLTVMTAAVAGSGFPAAAATDSRDDVQSTVVEGQIAPRLQNLGNHRFPVTTTSARAQLFINQGMMLTYGFNHAEAARSFREAAHLDPNCAMAYWGTALVLGPNINMAMAPEAEPKAYELLQATIARKKEGFAKRAGLCRCFGCALLGRKKSGRQCP